MTVTVSSADVGGAQARRSARPVSKEPLQIRIPTALKRRFKAHAAMRGIEPNQLFVEVWEHYEASLKAAPTTAEP